MLQEPVEPAWPDAFGAVPGRCFLRRGRHTPAAAKLLA